MEEFNIILLIIGGIVLFLGVFSDLIKSRAWFSEPIIALAFGIVIGPSGLGVLDSVQWGKETQIVQKAARVTLGISLMAAALRVPGTCLFHQWRSLSILLGVVMPLMWLIASILVLIILGVPFMIALLIGAVITPTDPVVVSAIVTSEAANTRLSENIRYTITSESGLNDGIALPLVALPILVLTLPSDVGSLIVFASILAHGFTARPLISGYKKLSQDEI